MIASSANTNHATAASLALRNSAAQPPLGLFLVLSVAIIAGGATIKDVAIGGVSYTGFLWAAYLGAMLLAVLAEKAAFPRQLVAFSYRRWLGWLAVVWMSLLWCSPLSPRNLQDALQISMPVLTGIGASMFVRNPRQLQILLQSFGIAVVLMFAITSADALGLLGMIGVASDPRITGLTATLAGCVLISAWPRHKRAAIAGWAACLLLSALTGSRTATLALLVLPILHPGYRNIRLRVLAVLAFVGLGIGLFYTDTFQQRFFASGSGTLTQLLHGEFLGFGRFYAWPLILDEALRQPILGHGVGTAHDFVPTVWVNMTHPHNDYLRIGFETGLVGLAVFLSVLVWQVISLRKLLTGSSGVVARGCTASLLGLYVFLIFAITDNPLVYNLWYTSPLFAVIGATYGVARRGTTSASGSMSALDSSTHHNPRR